MGKKKNKRKAIYVGSAVLISLLLFALQAVVNNSHHQAKSYSQQLEQKASELQTLQKAVETVHAEKADTESQLQEKAAKEAELKAQIDELNAQLQSKAEAKEAARVAALQKPVVQTASRSISGDCGSWLAAAGVSDTSSAMGLISRESGCNPYAVNASSGACGVSQELPCGKSGCNLGDGACQVAWMNTYVASVYGSWANALSHSLNFNWY